MKARILPNFLFFSQALSRKERPESLSSNKNRNIFINKFFRHSFNLSFSVGVQFCCRNSIFLSDEDVRRDSNKTSWLGNEHFCKIILSQTGANRIILANSSSCNCAPTQRWTDGGFSLFVNNEIASSEKQWLFP